MGRLIGANYRYSGNRIVVWTTPRCKRCGKFLPKRTFKWCKKCYKIRNDERRAKLSFMMWSTKRYSLTSIRNEINCPIPLYICQLIKKYL